MMAAASDSGDLCYMGNYVFYFKVLRAQSVYGELNVKVCKCSLSHEVEAFKTYFLESISDLCWPSEKIKALENRLSDSQYFAKVKSFRSTESKDMHEVPHEDDFVIKLGDAWAGASSKEEVIEIMRRYDGCDITLLRFTRAKEFVKNYEGRKANDSLSLLG